MKQNLTNLKHFLNILFLLFALTTCAFAADGDLDTTFNAGLAKFPPVANLAVVQPDGRTIIGDLLQSYDNIPRFGIAHNSTAALIPTLGNYPNATIPLSDNTTIMPDAAPTTTTRITVSTSTNFKGELEGNPTTGIVRVTDAHPAGTYTVTVTAFDSMGITATRTFTLTVTTPVTCLPVDFSAPTTFNLGTTTFSVTIGDFNGDGIQDIVTASSDLNSVSVLLGNGAGSFGAATNFGTGNSPRDVAVGDFNGDGNQDLATANGGATTVSVLLGNGAGGFGTATNFVVSGNNPNSVAVGDFNNDGNQDLVATTPNLVTVSVLLGNGTGSFGAATEFDTVNGAFSVTVGDFNGDIYQDIVTTCGNFCDGISVLLGTGGGNFGAATAFGTGGAGCPSISGGW